MRLWKIEQQIETVKGLIAMRKAGKFEGVFVDESRITLQVSRFPDVRRYVFWDEAKRQVDEFRELQARKKPAQAITRKRVAEAK